MSSATGVELWSDASPNDRVLVLRQSNPPLVETSKGEGAGVIGVIGEVLVETGVSGGSNDSAGSENVPEDVGKSDGTDSDVVGEPGDPVGTNCAEGLDGSEGPVG